MKTVNLELSKQLKEAGYPQEAEKWWWEDNFGLEKNKSRTLQDKKPHNPKNGWVYFASPTSDEILEQLPDYIRNPENGDLTPLWFCRNKYTKDFIAQYHIAFSAPLYEQRADALADAIAKMWLYLKKEGLL